MRKAFIGFGLFLQALASPSPCPALTERDIQAARLEQHPGALLPMETEVRDRTEAVRSLGELIGDKPALLLFIDYSCRTLCGTTADVLADKLEQTGLTPGADYRVLVFGFNPKDGAGAAQAFVAAHSSAVAEKAFSYVTASPEAIGRLSQTVGFNAVYDAENDQYAHPAAVITISPAGRVGRYLDVLGVQPGDLRLTLIEAGEGRVGSITDQLILVCYGWDATKGAYTPLIRRILTATGVTTALCLGGGLFIAFRRERAAGDSPKGGEGNA